MSLIIQNDPMPLQPGSNNRLRIGKTHIFLDTVVAAYKSGATAEEIVRQFPSLVLADVYAVLSYYLRHQLEIEAYLEQHQVDSDHEKEQEKSLLNGSTPKVNHPIMALANLGECEDPTVSSRSKEILSQEIDLARGWSVTNGGSS